MGEQKQGYTIHERNNKSVNNLSAGVVGSRCIYIYSILYICVYIYSILMFIHTIVYIVLYIVYSM